MKTSVSLIALVLMAACSAAASQNVEAAPSIAPSAPIVAMAPASAVLEQVAQASQRVNTQISAPHAMAASDPVSCDVRMRPTANGMLIQAIARADRAFDGEYELVVTKNGGGGSADVTQGGPVSVAAGDAVTLSSTELSAGRYRAVLTLSDAAGEVCRLERQS